MAHSLQEEFFLFISILLHQISTLIYQFTCLILKQEIRKNIFIVGLKYK